MRQQLPDVEMALLAEEEQAQRDANALVKAQWDANALVKALKEANRKCNELANKCCDAHTAREKCKVDQHKADMKVRGRLLANAAMAEVQRQYVCQVKKARLVAEKL